MDYEKVLGERKFPTYEQLKSGLLRLIDEGKIAREDAGRLLPELRESEDERIRKEIIKFIQDFCNPCDPDCDKWIAYLEKQEQKPAEWSEEDKKMIDTIVSVLGQYIDYKAEPGTGSGYATPRYSKEISWLKSLRPMLNEK